MLIFYFNIAGLIIFLVFSRFRSFNTLREKAGYGSNLRYKVDFLDFCKDDIHWFTIVFQQLFLCIYALSKRVNSANFSITGWLSIVLVRHIYDFIVIYKVFFTQKDLYFSTKFIQITGACSILTNILLGIHFYQLLLEGSIFWAPYILMEIVLHAFAGL